MGLRNYIGARRFTGGVTYTSEYQAILTQAVSLGYTLPSVSQRIKQDAFIIALKAALIWTKLDVLYVFATDGDSNYATLNWKNPTTFQLSKVNSPTFTSNVGFNGNGTTQYLNTNWAAGTSGVNYTSLDASCFTYINSNVSEAKADFGVSNGAASNCTQVQTRSGANLEYRINKNSGVIETVANAGSIGSYLLKKVADANRAIWKNGVFLGASGASVGGGGATFNMILLGTNNVNVPQAFSTKQMGVFSAGASLAGLELTCHTTWNNYFTGL